MRARFRGLSLLGLLLTLLAVGLAAPARAPGAAAAPVLRGDLLVFAAASLTDAFGELGRALQHTHPGLRITFTFAASSLLRTQIAQGARADVFASADERTMAALHRAGRLATAPVVFARNEPVVVVPSHRGVAIATLRDLARPGVKVVLPSPEVPIGAYARRILAQLSRDPTFGASFAERVLRNVVSQEPHVRAALARVALGEADATFVYRSDLSSAYGRQVRVLAIPRRANVIATFPIAVVQDAPHAPAARAFVAFVLSPPGQQILVRWGFLPARD